MIRWTAESELNRLVGRCGKVPIGHVFLRARGARYVRWRALVTKAMYPVDGTSPTVEHAQQQIAIRFTEFLVLARLQPIPENN